MCLNLGKDGAGSAGLNLGKDCARSAVVQCVVRPLFMERVRGFGRDCCDDVSIKSSDSLSHRD